MLRPRLHEHHNVHIRISWLFRSLTSARQRRPFVEERHDPRPRDVAGFQPVEPKARFGKQIVDLAVEVTPAREPQPERIEAILPAGDTRLRRASTPGSIPRIFMRPSRSPLRRTIVMPVGCASA